MKPHRITWRIIALLAAIGNIIFNYRYIGREQMGDITDQYNIAFVPAGYAFAIWGVIYLSVLIYVVYSLLPKQQMIMAHEALAKWVAALSVLGTCWLLAYTSLHIALSVGIIVVMLIVALLSAIAARRAITERTVSNRTIIPFALYGAWLSVATIANISVWLKSSGWQGGLFSESTWAVVMLIVSGILGVLAARKFKTVVFPLVIAWACIAIYVEQQRNFPTVAFVALAVAVVQLIYATVWLLISRHHGRRAVLLR